MALIRKRMQIVGDGGCGKTCLVTVFMKGVFPEVYIPKMIENCVVDVEVDGQQVELALWENSAQDDENIRLRPLMYPASHAILICFAPDSPKSLGNVEEKWIPIMRHFCPNSPIVLVCCKKDLREDAGVIENLRKSNQTPSTYEEGMAVAEKIGAKHYVECSAYTGEGVREVFDLATRAVLVSERRRHGRCVVM